MRKKAEKAATMDATKVQNFLDFSKAGHLDIEHNLNMKLYRCNIKFRKLSLSPLKTRTKARGVRLPGARVVGEVNERLIFERLFRRRERNIKAIVMCYKSLTVVDKVDPGTVA